MFLSRITDYARQDREGGTTIQVCTIASGSSGNAMLLSCGGTHLLLDAGISARRITTALKELGVEPGDLSGILITHEHTDHIAGVATLTKQLSLPVYATDAVCRQLHYRIPFLEDLLRPVCPGKDFALGEVGARPFATPHDSAGSVGYVLEGGGARMALCTDLGHLTPEIFAAVEGADLLAAELNHDEDWVRSGGYPYPLQQRILGDYGHLSNEAGAELVLRGAMTGARTILLSHLSSQNNTPARALETAQRRLGYAGIDPERDLHLSVAPRSAPGPLYQLARGQAPKILARREGAAC